MYKKYFFGFLLTAVMSSCSTDSCNPENSVFNRLQPEDSIYQMEVTSVLKKHANKSWIYHFNKLEIQQNQRMVYVDLKSDAACATAIMKIDDNSPIFKDTDAKELQSYFGAEMINLKYHFENNDIVLDEVQAMVD